MKAPTVPIVRISARISPLKTIMKTKDARIGMIAISCISTVGVATVRSILVLPVNAKNVAGRCKQFKMKKLAPGIHRIISSKSLFTLKLLYKTIYKTRTTRIPSPEEYK